MNKILPVTDLALKIKVRVLEESARRIRVINGPDVITGKFWFYLSVTALTKDIYIPLSISSSNKPTGFIYQIEGNATGKLVKADIDVKGREVTRLALGTLVYCKIPAGLTAELRLRIEIRCELGKTYRAVIRQLNFKFDPGDSRYQKLPISLQSKLLKYR